MCLFWILGIFTQVLACLSTCCPESLSDILCDLIAGQLINNPHCLEADLGELESFKI